MTSAKKIIPFPKKEIRRREEELAFLPAALEIVETPPSPTRRAIGATIIALFCLALIWATLGSVDIVATAPGKIIPSGRTKVIQPFETGVVSAIHVRDGQSVKVGDVLIELDPTMTEAEVDHLKSDLIAAGLDVARLRAALAGNANPLEDFRPPEGASPALIEMNRQFLISQTAEQQAKLAALDRQVAQKEAERATTAAEYRRTRFEELTKAEQKAAGFAQDVIKAERRTKLQALTAPVDGVVQQLAVHTVGGVVTPAQALLAVVPLDSHLEIEAMVSNRDIGFVHADQEAEIKIDTFSFTRYGLLHGKVLNLSQDAIARDKPQDKSNDKAPGAENSTSEPRGQELNYAARVSLDRTQMQVEDKLVNLSPGMAVTVEIKTGTRRIISYLLSPLLRYKQEVLRER